MLRALFFALVSALPVAAQPKDAPEAFAFDPQPKTLAPSPLHWWNIAVSPESRAVTALAYSPDGNLLAVASERGEIALWDRKSRQRTATLTGHTADVSALSWSANSARLASAAGEKHVIVWDVAAKKPLQTLKHISAVYAIAISSDGKTVATGGFDKVIRLWDAETGEEKAKREGHTASVRCLAFGPDNRLASGAADYTVRVWNLNDNKPPKELRGHSKTVRAVAFVGAGSLATTGDDGGVRIWSLADGEAKQPFGPFADGVPCLASSPKGTFVAIGLNNGKVQLLDPAEAQTRAVLSGSNDPIAAVAIAPDGRQIAAGGADKIVRLWNAGVSAATPAAEFDGHIGAVRGVAASSTGTVATGGSDGTIRLWKPDTGQVIANWPAHEGPIEDLSFNADGTLLASGGEDKLAKVWRVADHTLVKSISGFPTPIRRVSLSLKGNMLAIAGTQEHIEVHELADGTVRKSSTGLPIVALQFLADDDLLVAGHDVAYLWDVRAARVLTNLDGGQFARIKGAAATTDGKLIVVAGEPAIGSQRPEDVGFSRVLAISRHHPTSTTQRLNDTGAGITRVSLSPDGRIISAVNGDGTLRAWEWPTLTPIRKLVAHDSPILALASSSRGEFLLTASADGTAKRWNASRGEALVYAAKLTDESKQAWFARVSPDGKVLATGGDDKVLRLRDGVPGRFRTMPGEYGCGYSAAVSPDGNTLVTGHFEGDIRVWDLKTGKQLQKLDGHAFRVWSLAFSPDGTRLVSGSGDWDQQLAGEIRIWDTANWKTLHEVPGHDDLVFQVAVSPDSKTIASGSRDSTVRTWELATGKPVHVLRMHTGGVRTIAYSKDGKQLYSGGYDGRLQWWDAIAGKALDGKSLGVSAVARMRLSPDGKTLALALKTEESRGYAALFDLATNEITRKFPLHDGQVNDVAFSPDGLTLVSAGGLNAPSPRYETGPIGPWMAPISARTKGETVAIRTVPTCEIRCWDVATGTKFAELPGHKHWIETLAFTPDGAQMIAVGGNAGQPGEIRLWDFVGIRPKALLVHPGGLTCGRFSPDGSRFAVGSGDFTITVWDVAKALASDASAKRVLTGHNKMVRNIAWSSDGSRLATCGEDGNVKLWDTKTWEPVQSIAAHEVSVYGIAFSPDGSMLATAAGDWKQKGKGEVKVWDAKKGTELFALPTTASSAWGVAFTADGKLITARMEDVAIRVYDLATKAEVKTLTAPTPARGLAISADGKWIGITAQANGIIKVWESATWREAFEVVAHPGKVVFTIDFAPDKETVLSAGGDGAVIVWKHPGGEWKIPSFVPPAPKRPGPRKKNID